MHDVLTESDANTLDPKSYVVVLGWALVAPGVSLAGCEDESFSFVPFLFFAFVPFFQIGWCSNCDVHLEHIFLEY